MKLHKLIMMAATACAAAGCSTAKAPVPAAEEQTAAPELIKAPTAKPLAGVMPKAIVYRMEGNASAANVPVQVSGSGSLTSFPAPIDVKGQEPIQLADGYLLDRRGISAASRFTRWTYAEYAALPATPTPDEILSSIIPGARATDIHVLPLTLSEAMADTAAVNKMIQNF